MTVAPVAASSGYLGLSIAPGYNTSYISRRSAANRTNATEAAASLSVGVTATLNGSALRVRSSCHARAEITANSSPRSAKCLYGADELTPIRRAASASENP